MDEDNSITSNIGRFKGQIGIVALAIGMVPMVLMMLLAGYQLSDAGLDSSLTAKLDSDQSAFQAEVILYQIMEANSTRYNIRTAPYQDEDTEEERKDEVRATAEEVLKEVEEYDFEVHYPNGDTIEVDEGSAKLYDNKRAYTYVASPEGDPITVQLEIEGTVAQVYHDYQTTRSTNNHRRRGYAAP